MNALNAFSNLKVEEISSTVRTDSNLISQSDGGHLKVATGRRGHLNVSGSDINRALSIGRAGNIRRKATKAA